MPELASTKTLPPGTGPGVSRPDEADDLMAPTRYGIMMLRFASAKATYDKFRRPIDQIRLTQSKPVVESALPPKADIGCQQWEVCARVIQHMMYLGW